jgi:type IV pilus assembly protein PilM
LAAKQNLIGIDIGSDSVKIVELKPKKKGFIVKNISEVKVTPDVIVEGSIIDYAEVADAVNEALGKCKYSSKKVATALKGNSVIAKKVSVPITDLDELRETFLWEAEQYIQMDIEDVSVDYEVIDIDEEAGKTDVILAVARKDLVVDYLSVLKTAKLIPMMIDLEVFALMNAFEANYEADSALTVLVNVGHTATHVAFLKDGEYEFSREISKGGRDLNEAIEKDLGVTYDEAVTLKADYESYDSNSDLKKVVTNFNQTIAAEVKNSYEMYVAEHEELSGRCFVSGGSCSLPGLTENIQNLLQMDVSFFDPFATMDKDKSLDKELLAEGLYRMNIAVGLALRSIKE